MKKIVFLIVTAVAMLSASAQNSDSFDSYFGVDSVVWNGVICYRDTPWENFVLRTANDTTISGVVYKKIESLAIYPSSVARLPESDFFLREDTSTGRLWCYHPSFGSEFLVSDMTLTMGDTISLHIMDQYLDHIESYVVTDTFSNENGRNIILRELACLQYAEDSYCPTVRFVEGVGCSNLFSYMRYPILESHLVCCHKDGEWIYHGIYDGFTQPVEDEDCIVSHVWIDTPVQSETVTIYPNPCGDWLKIDGDDIRTASLYDAMGRRILSDLESDNPISTKALAKGVYLLRIENNGVQMSKIIVKQ